MTTVETMNEVLATLQEAAVDADKFDKGNSAAGTRVRKACMDVTKTLKVLRGTVQEAKNARKG